jgi:hypothetical protein
MHPPWRDFENRIALFPVINGWAIFIKAGFAEVCRDLANRRAG